jgi:hypothetical protein
MKPLVYAMAFFLVVVSRVAAQKPTPESLESPELKTFVDRFLNDPTKESELKQLRKEIVLDVSGLKYLKGRNEKGEPSFVVYWELRTVDAKPVGVHGAKLKEDVENWIKNLIGQQGLLQGRSELLTYSIVISDGIKQLALDRATTEDFRRHVRTYLDSHPSFAETLSPLVTLDVDGLTFNDTNRPGALAWTLRLRYDLGADEELVRKTVLLLLITALEQHDGGLLQPDEMAVLRPLIRVRFNPPTTKPPEQQSVVYYQWYWIPSCCCGSSPQWYYLATEFRGNNACTAVTRTPRAKPEPINLKGRKVRDAPDLYARGFRAYADGEYETALVFLEAATALVDDDARFWCYRALTERALNDLSAAQQSVERAAELRRQGKVISTVLASALESVQGPTRRWLREAMDAADRTAGR